MAEVVYFLCALTSLSCFVLLFRAWRGSGARLLFWSSMCFAGMTVNNTLLVLDKVVFPTEVDLGTWRLAVALAAVLLLVFGLVWEEE
ncbi:hypothetical protein EZ313_22805 [Ramlibacter henchirensis]|uniref:Uncharacterized protein n=1 Tax=Ramlibacter henchirensis TaxID=204072 RepID=A0A4Z0BLU1_9BURK|nr:DUF5985 family protein [Ramlibacter henchirensis]TFY99383.1 hypothetical protein EZ313_22805 [Ramlibacter henchirensis]